MHGGDKSICGTEDMACEYVSRKNMLIYLVKLWSNTWRKVCADSYFSSVTSINELNKTGLHFFDMVKTATKKYPMHFSNCNDPHERGNYKKLASMSEDGDSVCAVAIMWLKKNRQCFVGNFEPATAEYPLFCVR